MNQITIAGILTSSPAFFDDRGVEMIKIHLRIERPDLRKEEKLMLISKDEKIIRRVLDDNLQAGDFFFTDNAYVETTNYIQEENWACSHCGEITYDSHQAEILNVIFNDYQFVRDLTNEGSHIGINHVTIMGRLLDDPTRLNPNPMNGFTQTRCKFKLAVPTKQEFRKPHYPFVVTFGEQAEQCLQNLKKGDKILIEGNIQERQFLKVKKGCVCKNCNWKSNPRTYMVIREIIARDVDYIETQNPPQNPRKIKQTKEE